MLHEFTNYLRFQLLVPQPLCLVEDQNLSQLLMQTGKICGEDNSQHSKI